MCMEAPDGLVFWSKNHQAFDDKAFEGVCLSKKEGQVLLRRAKYPWFLQYLIKKFFWTYFIKSVKRHVFSMNYLKNHHPVALWGLHHLSAEKLYCLSLIWASQGAVFGVAPCSSICLKQEIWLCPHYNFSPSEGVVSISSLITCY